MTGWYRVLWSCVLACTVSCTVEGPTTGVVVTVRAESSLAQAVDRLDLVVRGGSGDPESWPAVHDGELPVDRWPLTFLLTPQGGDITRGYEVVLRGFRGEEELVRARARSGWIAGRMLALEIGLLDSCRGVLCEAGSTCQASSPAGCSDAERPPQSLPDHLNDLPEIDVMTSAQEPETDEPGDVQSDPVDADAGPVPDDEGDGGATRPPALDGGPTTPPADAGMPNVDGEDACTERLWYGDADNDGLGDALVSLSACEQPEGYVAEADDQQPECGTNDTDRCGVCGGDDSSCNVCLDNGGSHQCEAVGSTCTRSVEVACGLDALGCRVEVESECEFGCGVRGCCEVDPAALCAPDSAPERCGTTYVSSCGVFQDCGECSQGVCIDGSCCVPQCADRDCGADGCGGTCGDCSAGDACRSDGVCGAPIHLLLAGAEAWSTDEDLVAQKHEVLRVPYEPGELPGDKVGTPLPFVLPEQVAELDALCVRADGTVGLSSAGAFGERTQVHLWDPASESLGFWFDLGHGASDLEALHCPDGETGTVYVSGSFPGGADFRTGDILYLKPGTGEIGVAVEGASFWGETKVVGLSVSDRGNFVVALEDSGTLPNLGSHDRRTLLELEFGPFKAPRSGYSRYLSGFDFDAPPASGWEALHIEN